jgi:cytoskeletal protein CcmA (bactofilin family)
MAVLSNNGRLISSLPLSSTIVDNDEFLLQSGGVTKRVTSSKIKSTVLTGLNPYTEVVKLKNPSNIFTGSFYGTNFSNFGLVLASGSFSGSYRGSIISKNTKATGSFSGSYFGNVTSKNTKASGSFSGSYFGNVTSKNTKATGSFSGNITSTNTKATGSFSGSYRGSIISKNTKASGSFSGSYFGNITSKNTKATGSFSGNITSTNTKASGSFSGSYFGKITSKNTKASGSFSGSYFGNVTSKNTKATGSFSGNITSTNTKASGSFSGSYRGSIISKNTKASGSFSGSYFGNVISKNTKATGSFSGNITSTNTKATGSFSGSYFGNVTSTNTKATGSFSGSYFGNVISTNTKATGSFSGSYFGNVISKNTKASGSFSGSYFGNVTSTNTKATGSFSGSYFGNVISKNTKATGSFSGNITSTNTKASGSFSGSYFGKVTGNVTGDITSTGGTSTFTKATITRLTSSNPILGDLRGDVYTQTGTIVLENGSGTKTANGGIPTAYFHGTSSYSSQALTAAYASAGGTNALPAGGSPYQVVAKDSTGTIVWANSITASQSGEDDYVAVWSGARSLKKTSILYDGEKWIIQEWLQTNNGILSNAGISIPVGDGAFTGSYVAHTNTATISEESDNLYKIIRGDIYASNFLKLSSSGYCTMSLRRGQTSTVFVQNSGPYKIFKWSGSLDGGTSANTKIYWKNAQSASITQGDQKKDVITFVNINDKIFGTVINNFA